MNSSNRKSHGDDAIVPHWHSQEAKILKAWSEVSASQQWMHQRAYVRLNRHHILFALPVIILSTLAGTANMATQGVPIDYREYVSYATGAINLICSILTTISQFLKISERREGHRTTANDYGVLSRRLSTELQLPIADRKGDGRQVLDEARKEIERLQTSAPDLPLGIVRTFGRRFRKTAMSKPNILKLFPVEVFEDDYIEAEKRRKDSEAAAAKREEAAAILAKAQAAEEFRKSVQDTVKTMRRQEHKKRKKSVSAGMISSSMTRFMSNLGSIGSGVELNASTQSPSTAFDGATDGPTDGATDGPADGSTNSVIVDVFDGDESSPTPCSLSEDEADTASGDA